MAGLLAAAVLLAAAADPQAAFCATYDGAAVVAADGAFLGRVTRGVAPDSIFNRLGSHGRKDAASSIWNPRSRNGGRYAAASPFNTHALRPPRLVLRGLTIGVLTIDRDRPGGVSPLLLGAMCYSYFPG